MQKPTEIDAKYYFSDILEFIACLFREEVRYVIVGGEAVIFHGYPRLTGDVDFYYDPAPENCQKLFSALECFWSGNIPGINHAKELQIPGIIIQFGRPPNRIDLLNSIDGVSFDEAWQGKIPVHIIGEGLTLATWYLGKAQLLINKKASGRPKDIDDYEHLG